MKAPWQETSVALREASEARVGRRPTLTQLTQLTPAQWRKKAVIKKLTNGYLI